MGVRCPHLTGRNNDLTGRRGRLPAGFRVPPQPDDCGKLHSRADFITGEKENDRCPSHTGQPMVDPQPVTNTSDCFAADS